ncbi:hypothetical protein EDC04DRAFT_3094136, partial [Pisolithus marmoratus]
MLSFARQLELDSPWEVALSKILVYMYRVWQESEKEAAEEEKIAAVQKRELDDQWRSKTLDKYLGIEFYIRRHEPAIVREFRWGHMVDVYKGVENFDWSTYNASLDDLWSGHHTRFTIQENDWTVKFAKALIPQRKAFYKWTVKDDTEFGYTYEEHKQSTASSCTRDLIRG